MINLKLTDISTSKLQDSSLKDNYLYKDIKLDLDTSYTYDSSLNKKYRTNDAQALYDIEAVKNSIATCFLTSPGQKILSPEFGMDLREYLFEPITNSNAYFLRSDILRKLPEMEPRVELVNVNVEADIDNQQYTITLQINVPSLNVYGVTLKNYLNSNGYY